MLEKGNGRNVLRSDEGQQDHFAEVARKQAAQIGWPI